MADLTFNCPRCGQNLTTDESLTGSEIECPSCTKPIKIPSAGDENVQRADAEPPAPPVDEMKLETIAKECLSIINSMKPNSLEWVDLEEAERVKLDEHYKRVLHRPIHQWGDSDKKFFKSFQRIPGRDAYLKALTQIQSTQAAGIKSSGSVPVTPPTKGQDQLAKILGLSAVVGTFQREQIRQELHETNDISEGDVDAGGFEISGF